MLNVLSKLFENRTAQQGGLIVLLLSLYPVVEPHISEYLNNKENKAIKLMIAESRDELIESMRVFNKQLILESREIAIKAHSKKREDTNSEFMDKVVDKVGNASWGKLDWIVRYMKSDTFVADKSIIRGDVEPELLRRTMVYVNSLNGTIHPKIGLAGDYLANNFEWKPFIDEVVEVMAMENKSIDSRFIGVSNVMRKYQNSLWLKMRKDIR
jgi:hypothetical protein